ncbi:S-adenosyl-L-methionine-dependent methyltransferase [Exophiala viscosa]|uniref:S-adenosyl-L-methionine-dependent methyltransferase n=1 Tax=Exophiala viscosa TaxID=2486360 RepID=A0AAN6DPD1_9EURO|nr:S-adenosyl-L-methionine-dependent methyltransferase [Exophiala viscosa]
MSILSTLADTLRHNLCELELELPQSSSPHLWSAQPCAGLDDPERLPSQKAFDLINKIRIDLKAVEALITPNQLKLIDLANLQFKVAALNTVVLLNVAGALDELGGEASLGKIAAKVNANEHKLGIRSYSTYKGKGRILRVLTAEFIFQEVSPNVFKHSRHSTSLSLPGARSFLSMITDIGLRAAAGLGSDISKPETKDSFAENTAPFVKVVSKDGKTFMEYMMDPENVEMAILANEGVVGWLNVRKACLLLLPSDSRISQKLTREALLTDYPWGKLGSVTIVDLGCGAGDSGIDVLKRCPDIKWIFQDFGPVLEGVKKAMPTELQDGLASGRISFVQQDYFQPNASIGTVYYLRGVLHEYVDEDVLKVLGHVAAAMRKSPGSKMLINEVLNSSPVIAPASSSSPPSQQIPEQQSALADVANMMTWSTFALFGGKERSYCEYEKLLNEAGLKISCLYKFRTFTVMLECELSNDKTMCLIGKLAKNFLYTIVLSSLKRTSASASQCVLVGGTRQEASWKTFLEDHLVTITKVSGLLDLGPE